MTKIIGLNDSIKFKDGKTYDVLWFDRSGIKLQARKGGTRLMPLSEFENLKSKNEIEILTAASGI